MRINRRLLYAGIFLVAIGVVLVATDVGGLTSAVIADGFRLWPLVPIAIGAGVVLRRTRFDVPAGLFAAAVPGLFVGGGLALGPELAIDCRNDVPPIGQVVREGVLADNAHVTVASGCGALIVSTAPGSSWQLDATNVPDRPAAVAESRGTLSIDVGGGRIWHGHVPGRDDARLTLPTSPIESLSLAVNAGHGEIDLPDARIGRLDLTTNAGQVDADLTGASVNQLSATVNAGALVLRLSGTSDMTADVHVNAGAIEVCAPAGLGLRVDGDENLGGFSVAGDEQSGTWESADYRTAEHRADLEIDVNFGNIAINPIGGCS